MEAPVQVTFRGMEPSDSVMALVRERAEKLGRFDPRIVSCHVVIDVPHRHRSTGRNFAVRLDIKTATSEIAVSRDPGQSRDHEDFGAVVRDAFAAAARQLEDETRRRRGDVKSRRH